MPLKALTAIEINGAADSLFDHGVFDPKTRRVSVEHAGLNRVEVIDHDAGHHLSTLHGFPETAGVVTDDGQVLVTNRGVAGLAWVDGVPEFESSHPSHAVGLCGVISSVRSNSSTTSTACRSSMSGVRVGNRSFDARPDWFEVIHLYGTKSGWERLKELVDAHKDSVTRYQAFVDLIVPAISMPTGSLAAPRRRNRAAADS
jgi:hypothetical protein